LYFKSDATDIDNTLREATPGAPSPGAQDSWPPEFSPGDEQETPGPCVHR